MYEIHLFEVPNFLIFLKIFVICENFFSGFILINHNEYVMMMYYTHLIDSGIGTFWIQTSKRTVMQRLLGFKPFSFFIFRNELFIINQSFGIKALSFLHFSTTDD